MDANYRSGAASLFASIARQAPQETKCEWCGEAGGPNGRYVAGFYIPEGHVNCIHNAKLASQQCCCFEFVGDNARCPVHGGQK